MTTYPVLTLATAPEASRPVLENLNQAFGLIPNIAGTMAHSPTLIGGFIGLFTAVHAGRLSEADIQILLLTNAVTNASTWPVAFHSFLALKAGVAADDIEAIRGGSLPSDAKYGALSALARALIETRGHPSSATLTAFYDAGFDQEQALEVIGVVAASTITNYTATLTEPPLEDFLQPHAWQPVS